MDKLSRKANQLLVSIILIVSFTLGYPYISGRIHNVRTEFAKKNRCQLNPSTSPFSIFRPTIYKCKGNTGLERKINNSFEHHNSISVVYLLILPFLLLTIVILITIFFYLVLMKK